MIRKTFSSDDDKTQVLIVGGTGTLGHAVLRRLLYENKYNITILSREELKQKKMKEKFPECKYVLADIRDPESLAQHFYGKEIVFHFAAMKHVDLAEENPEESIKINLLGTLNVAKACIGAGVPYCVFSSTDKAVLPINVYGMCKGISERYLLHLNKEQNLTNFSVFRWGNVLGSRGSVIHSFLKSLREKNEIHITDPRMTRFWIDIDDAARFILDNYESAPLDSVLFPPMRGASILKLADCCARFLGISNYKTNYSGIRAGEKIHEVVFSSHEACVRSDNCTEFEDEDLMQMIERAANL